MFFFTRKTSERIYLQKATFHTQSSSIERKRNFCKEKTKTWICREKNHSSLSTVSFQTNGSLYESLSLGRRCHCEKRPPRSLRPSISSNEENSSASVSLPSPAWTGTAYDSFDDPLTGSRRSFRSISDLSVSSGPTSPWGEPHTVTSTTASNEYSRWVPK